MIKAIITTLNNLPNLKDSVAILKDEPIDEIIVVNNGSSDGTKEWLDKQRDVTAIHRGNDGAGPGRNSGIDAAGETDYYLFLDGGIRPLRGGTRHMLDYLQDRYEADVIGVEIPDFVTDASTAWRRWPYPIRYTYQNRRLSHTAYCLARFRAFDGIRFCEEGPFGEPGWGADDDEMMYQWNEAGIVVHVISCQCNHGKPCTGVHPYRRASGSFGTLYRKTGIWPTQYGSVYEKRVVWLQQNWPQYQPGVQWGEPWLTVVVMVSNVESTSRLIKSAHDQLRRRKFNKPWHQYPNPYSIVALGGGEAWKAWAEERRLRQHHGDIYIDRHGEIVKKIDDNKDTWTGDFRLWDGDWREAVRPTSYYYGLVSSQEDLDRLIESYNQIFEPRGVNIPPSDRGEIRDGRLV